MFRDSDREVRIQSHQILLQDHQWMGGGVPLQTLSNVSPTFSCGIGRGSARDFSFSRILADLSLAFFSSLISGSFSRYSRSVCLRLMSCFKGTYSGTNFQEFSVCSDGLGLPCWFSVFVAIYLGLLYIFEILAGLGGWQIYVH